MSKEKTTYVDEQLGYIEELFIKHASNNESILFDFDAFQMWGIGEDKERAAGRTGHIWEYMQGIDFHVDEWLRGQSYLSKEQALELGKRIAEVNFDNYEGTEYNMHLISFREVPENVSWRETISVVKRG